jgi:redox-regulated HSP33 family molecular chaperone
VRKQKSRFLRGGRHVFQFMPYAGDKTIDMLQRKTKEGTQIRVFFETEESFFQLIENHMLEKGYELVETLKKRTISQPEQHPAES